MTQAVHAARGRLVGPAFLLITFSTFFYFTSLGALIPTIPPFVDGPLGGGPVAIGLVVGVLAITAVILRPWVGRVGDRRGRRLLIVGGSVVMAASIAGYLVVDAVAQLAAFRLVNGVGEAMFYVGAATAINDLAPDDRRGEAVSIFSMALYGGLIIGPVLGETVLRAEGFAAVWLASAAASGAAALIGAWVPDTRPEPAEPPAARRLVHPAGIGPGLVLATSIWGLASFNTFIPLYAPGVGLDGSRFVFVTFSVIVLLIRFFGRRIPDVLGPRRAGAGALVGNAAGLAVLAAWPSVIGVFVGTGLFAIGQALAFPAMMTLAVGGAPASERGAVIGTFTAFFDLAFGAGAVSLGAVVALVGLRGNFAAASGVALLGLAFLLVYGRRWRRGPDVVAPPPG